MPTKSWMEERQQVTAWLTKQEYDLLRRGCLEEGKSIADVLREAIQAMLETVPITEVKSDGR